MTHIDSPAALLAFGTAVPEYTVDQAALCGWMTESLGNEPHLSRWLRHLYRASGISTRYSCIPDAHLPPASSRFAPGNDPAATPTTAERMAIYERVSVEIGLRAARAAISDRGRATGQTDAMTRAGITHLIVVSCTGFFAPGLDVALARELGLRADVQRTLIGFMGCAAAFNALRMADQIVGNNGAAQVLVVCIELCSLHLQAGTDRVNLTVGSLFADGAAACLVGRPTSTDGDVLLINRFHTELTPDTEGDMAWRIGNHGFVMGLSPQIPRLLGQVAPGALATLLEGAPRPSFWAVHPGGRSIVDQIERTFDMTPDEIAPTRAILNDYGNMSSPTVLFVLQRVREQVRQQDDGMARDGVAMAFGPGLVTEMVHLTYVPQQAARQQEQVDYALA